MEDKVSETDVDAVMTDMNRRMSGAVEVLKKELSGLRTGRASAHLLEPIVVEAYGNQMPLNQLGTVGVPEPRMLSVQVWDKSMVKAVDRAIRDSGLGLNPIIEGQLLRVPIPALTEERRAEIVKIAHRYAEEARVAVRNVRRHGMDEMKKAEKEGGISEDEHREYGKDLQQLTDGTIKQIDQLLATKEQEIMQV
jgi:ribosome recycling factor